MIDKWIDIIFTANFVATLAYFGIWLAVRYGALKWIMSANMWHGDEKIRARSVAKGFFLVLLFLGVLFIWGEATSRMLVSLFVFLSAMGFAVKELLACVSGSLMRFRSKTYSLGDRISIGSLKGDVVDMNLLSTTLLEVGPNEGSLQHSGRRITFSNSRLLKEAVINESLLHNFSFHTLALPLQRSENWKLAKQILIDTAQEHCASFLDAARRRFSEVEKTLGSNIPDVEPRIWIEMADAETLTLYLRMAAPIAMRGRLEQAVLDEFLEKFYPIRPLEDVLGKTISHKL